MTDELIFERKELEDGFYVVGEDDVGIDVDLGKQNISVKKQVWLEWLEEHSYGYDSEELIEAFLKTFGNTADMKELIKFTEAYV